MQKTERFAIYKHRFVYQENKKIIKQFIVLKHTDGTMTFTNFHKYAFNPNMKIRKYNDDGNNRFIFIVKFLNYAFFTAGISSLDELTIEIGADYLNAYGMHQLSDDDDFTRRSIATVMRCVSCILDFYVNLVEDKNSGCKFKRDDLYKFVTHRNKYGKVEKKRIPKFEVQYIPQVKTPIFRDMPNKAFSLIFDHIAINHTDLLGIIMHQAFAGLRPSEACNVRRMDSPLGAGIRFTEVGGRLMKVSIDLTTEYNLRSDFISVGNIKKERTATVPDIFLSAYSQAYNTYMDYMKDKKYEAAYGAFSLNKQGKAITYDSYAGRFKSIIKDEMIPIFLHSSDEELVLYGQTLLENSLSPHVFRHWFTVQLVLSGMNEPGMIMHYRGDTSPESALTYINNKGDLEKQFKRISNETFNYTMWAARKKYGDQ
ncbi:MAG: hypothetical protein K6G03_00175 [Lachnospiraceae bacterium]|nr:hypothetical protein [Lachnospiraceae bacterium]